MELVLDCLPCLLRQSLEAARMATRDEAVQGAIMDEAIQVPVNHRTHGCAPELAAAIHAIVKQRTGQDDPSRVVKARDVAAALPLEPSITLFVAGRPDVLLRGGGAFARGTTAWRGRTRLVSRHAHPDDRDPFDSGVTATAPPRRELDAPATAGLGVIDTMRARDRAVGSICRALGEQGCRVAARQALVSV